MEQSAPAALYESVARDVSSMIMGGLLQPGARVPSVRMLSRQKRISVSTVLQAYSLLENRGLIEARPQSGYYVRPALPVYAEPAVSKPPRSAQMVGVQALITRVLEASQDERMVALGPSIPHATLVPTAQLQRMVTSIARQHPRALTTYSFPPGREELRRQIALHMHGWGVKLAADEIIVTHGCVESVNLCLRAVAKPGDVVVLESPTYFGLLQVIESLGMKALELPTHPRDGISLDALEAALGRSRIGACVLMPAVSNPLGSAMSESAKRRLVQMLAEHNVPLIEDAVYADLIFDAPALAAKSYDKSANVMLCGSFSKTFAPGFRLGWVAPGRFQAQVQLLKFISSGGVSDLVQLAAARYLETGGYARLLRTLRSTYARQMERVRDCVFRHFPQGTKVTRPAGGTVLWVEMPPAIDAIVLHRLALKEHISLTPGPMFCASGLYRNCLRLSCTAPWHDSVAAAIARVGTLAHTLNKPAARASTAPRMEHRRNL